MEKANDVWHGVTWVIIFLGMIILGGIVLHNSGYNAVDEKVKKKELETSQVDGVRLRIR